VDGEQDTTAEQGPSETRAERRVSRKQFLATGAAAGAAIGVGANLASARPRSEQGSTGSAAAAKGGDDEELILHNGRIHTLDDRNRIVDAVAIRNGRIAELGRDVQKRGKNQINLKGRTVIPGLIEGHVHVVSLANRPGHHVVIEQATNIAEIQELLAARRPSVPAGEFITAMGGWHPNFFAERRLPNLAELDAAVPDRPVFVYQGGGGPSVTNSLGKTFFETVSDALAGPVTVGADGSIATGNPNQSNRALYHLRVRQTFEDKKRSTHDAMAYSASVGLTALLDQVLPPATGPLSPTQGLPNLDHFRMYDPWLALHREEKTFVRLQMNFLHNQNDIDLPELKERLKNQFQLFGDDMMMTGGIGEWGAPGDGSGPVWLEAQRVIAQARWRNTNRTLSLAALENVVAGLETVDAEFDISGLRWTVHHVQVATNELLNRLKAIDVGVQTGAWRYSTGTPTANGSPFRLVVDNGIKAGIHMDGVHIAPLTPWFAIYYATTGVNALGVLINDGQQITRQEALRLYTRENAWHLNMEDRIGTIETGKLADLVVLDKDMFSVTDEELKRIKPVLTVIDGRIAYDGGVLRT
jgi:predicted amidohydrolase YtcJ